MRSPTPSFVVHYCNNVDDNCQCQQPQQRNNERIHVFSSLPLSVERINPPPYRADATIIPNEKTAILNALSLTNCPNTSATVTRLAKSNTVFAINFLCS